MYFLYLGKVVLRGNDAEYEDYALDGLFHAYAAMITTPMELETGGPQGATGTV
jgi:hypothetical protein